MELRKNPDSMLDIVVKKTTIVLQPNKDLPSARVVILTHPDETQSITAHDNQVLIEGPGEYEVDDVTISAIASPGEEGQACFLYVNIQTLEHSVAVLPTTTPVPDKVVEKLGVVDVVCLSFEPINEENAKTIPKVLKAFPDLKKAVLVCGTTPAPALLEELGSTSHPPVNSLKLKDMLQTNSDTIEMYCLVA